MTRAALYARVSTSEREELQNPENQLIRLRAYCQFREWQIVREYVEHESGRNDDRPVLNDMLKDARRGHFDYIAVFKLDRLTRSPSTLIRILDSLKKSPQSQEYYVNVVSTEEGLDTSSPLAAGMMTILSVVASWEVEGFDKRRRAGIEQAAKWWHDPGSCDIEDIDVAGKPKRNILGFGNKAQRRAQARIPVTATKLEESAVRRNLVQSFTNDELTRLGKARVKIHVYPRTHTAVGTYESGRNLVTVDRKHSIPQTTITHEAVHALRDKDRSRRGILKRSGIPGIEESLTVAEQQARTDMPGLSGYYWDCKVYDQKSKRWRKPTDKEAIRMAEEDHKLFTEGRGKGLRGAAAMESVSRNWSRSHIARLSYKSKGKMAVNQAAGIYLGIEPLSMKGKTPKKRASEGVSVPVSRPTAVAAEKRTPKRAKGRKTAKNVKKSRER